MLITTCIYVFVSRRLFRLTISRVKLIPVEVKRVFIQCGVISAALMCSWPGLDTRMVGNELYIRDGLGLGGAGLLLAAHAESEKFVQSH